MYACKSETYLLNVVLPKKINQVRNHPNAIEVGLIYDVPKYLQEVCCLVSPFAKPHFSLPVLEAFASHEPVIVIDIAGTSDVVKHGLNGLVVKKTIQKNLPMLSTLCVIMETEHRKWE